MTQTDLQARVEALGPAERILQTLLTHETHMVHNRPGIVTADTRAPSGILWKPVTHKVEDGVKVVYRLDKVSGYGRRTKTVKQRVGVLEDDGQILNGGRIVGRYQKPGLLPEVAAWLYKSICDVYQMDEEFVARWASYAFGQEHRDLKVALAAFMLVQPRCGEAIREGGEVLFHDDDFREIGEAMLLLRRKDGKDLSPKLVLRVGEFLRLKEIADINREMGWGNSTRRPAMGRYNKAVEHWLRHRENNVPILQGLVNAGLRSTVRKLASSIGYKPEGEEFFKVLRWKQKQVAEGHRTLALNMEMEKDTWDGLTEEEVCEKIVSEKVSYKVAVGKVPSDVGITRATMAACIEVGLSDKDLIILTPTLEELGLLDVPAIHQRWKQALSQAEDRRAENIAKRVKRDDVAEALEEAADEANKTAVEEALRGLRMYWFIDRSGSMQNSIETAKLYLTQLLRGFPLDKLHVAHFNAIGREVNIRHASKAGIEQSLRGVFAAGGTSYGAGVLALAHHVPEPDEDVLMVFVGDQEQYGTFDSMVRESGLRPNAFAMVNVEHSGSQWVVRETAAALGIPYFEIDAAIFEDPYAVTRTLQRLMASTPAARVGTVSGRMRSVRKSLVQTILETEPLKKPVWAA